MKKEHNLQSKVAHLIVGVFFLIPFLIYPVPEDPYSSWIFPRVIALGVLGLTGVMLYRPWTSFRSYPEIILMLVYIIGVLASTMASKDEKVYLFIGHEQRYDGLIYQISLFLWLMSAAKIMHGNSSLSKTVAAGYVFIGLSQAALLLSNFLFGFDLVGLIIYGGTKTTYPTGTLGFKALLTLAAGTAAIFVAALWSRCWAGKLITTFLGFSTGLAAGRAALVGAISASVLGFFSGNAKKRFIFLALLATIAMGAIIRDPLAKTLQLQEAKVLSAYTLKTRLRIWDLSLYIVRKHHGLLFRGLGADALRYTLITELPQDPQLKRKLSDFLRLEEKLPTKHVEDLKIKIHPEYGLRSAAIQLNFVNEKTGRPSIMLASVQLDKAHNLFLDIWLRYGLIATLAYFIFAFGPIAFCLKSLVGCPKKSLFFALILILEMHFFHYLAWFTMPLWEPYFLTISLLAWKGAKFSVSKSVSRGTAR